MGEVLNPPPGLVREELLRSTVTDAHNTLASPPCPAAIAIQPSRLPNRSKQRLHGVPETTDLKTSPLTSRWHQTDPTHPAQAADSLSHGSQS